MIWMAAAAALGLLAALLSAQAGLPALVYGPAILLVILLGYRMLDERTNAVEPRVPLRPRASQPARGAGEDIIGISALADPALIVSGGWRVLAANEGALQLFGQRIIGGDVRQTVRHPVVIEAVRLGLSAPVPILREVSTLGVQDGAFRVRVVTLDPVPDVGAGGRLLLTFTDVTQARLTERMRADFVANASHELRTPLANISGFIETLLGPASEDEPARRRFLDIMSREAARMSRLIDDLLSLSRIELDKYVRPESLLDLEPLLADVRRTLAVRLEADGRQLLLHMEPGLPQVLADRDQILQVLHNLVSNALKYGRTGTPILLSAAREPGVRGEDMVRVSIRDEGDGIAPEHLPRLTERFYRIDTGRSRSMGGTGLGLAIVKHIVERHRGRLDIASRLGEGTTVAFTLPAIGAGVTPFRAADGQAAEGPAPEAEAPEAQCDPQAQGPSSQNRNQTVT